ncbi:MAG: GyrI-like domain-containing protein [Planctomycetes bacterium]|nr:GyrI-like domain-containing protein [Planctomycetota bacterium]
MKAQEKIDLYKLHKDEYAASREPRLVETGKATYLAISGQGAPGGEAFTASIGALYGMAFTVKMTRKFAGLQDYAVCKLEGLWLGAGQGADLAAIPKDQWRWKLLIRTPDFVTAEETRKAAALLLKRGKGEEVKRVRLESLAEGRCVQMLHVGPYEKEGESIDAMRAFAEKAGLRLLGPHHEFYLSDPRRVSPERLKTILRQPVARR